MRKVSDVMSSYRVLIHNDTRGWIITINKNGVRSQIIFILNSGYNDLYYSVPLLHDVSRFE